MKFFTEMTTYRCAEWRLKACEQGIQRRRVAEVFEAEVECVGIQEAEVQLEAGGVGAVRRRDSRHHLEREQKSREAKDNVKKLQNHL